jgi:hypothetical protein
MRIAALLVAVFSILVGIVGLASPDSVLTVRRMYYATPLRLLVGAAVRVAMGLVVILYAPDSRAPRILRVLGILMCMQGFGAMFFGYDRARAIAEWEATQGKALLRVGAAVALAAGVFMAVAVTGGRLKGGELR